MRRFKYIKLSNSKKIRYLTNYYKKNLYIIFLHGFMSDLEGDKPLNFLKFCKKKELGFLGMEYSGHGKSSGKFIEGNISKWTNQVKIVIKKIVKKNDFILVGSSMGVWLSINQFKFFKNKIKGFLGIGSAPEFLERLMWKKFSKKIKNTILKKKIYYLKIDNFIYPITRQLIFDGRKNKILNYKINLKIPIVLFHGLKDDVVPLNISKKILKSCKMSIKKLIKIKNGNHSLSKKKDLRKICRELKIMLEKYIK